MPDSSQFVHLMATWPEHPTGTAGAAVAEGLRKRGSLVEARAVADRCVALWPGYLPGFIVLARIQRDTGDLIGAELSLRDALATDPSHPVVFADLAVLADLTGHSADARAWRQMRAASVQPEPPGTTSFLAAPASTVQHLDLGESEPTEEDLEEPGEEVFTESLAALYQAQGHLERAVEVYRVLALRAPENTSLASRRDALLDEILRRRPRPYDARQSQGMAVGNWLRQMARHVPTNEPTQRAGYDAFFQAPVIREAPEDFEAFQSWLKGLGR